MEVRVQAVERRLVVGFASEQLFCDRFQTSLDEWASKKAKTYFLKDRWTDFSAVLTSSVNILTSSVDVWENKIIYRSVYLDV